MIAHNPDCYIAKKIKDENIAKYESIYYAANDGYRLCKHCDPMHRLFKEKRTTMEKYCQERGITYTVENGDLIIVTPHSEWKVFIKNGGKFLLYHKNTAGCKNHYHLQSDKSKNLMAIFKYIHGHDNYRLKNPLKKRKSIPKKKTLEAPKMGKRGCQAKMRNHKRRQRARDAYYVLKLIDAVCD